MNAIQLKSQSDRCRRGFTIIEILSVLAVFSVIAVGVLSSLPNSDATLSAEVDRLSSHVRYTQIRAQADVHQWRLVFTDVQTYQIGPVVVPGAGFTPVIIPGSDTSQRILTEGVTASAGTAIRFDSWGRPLSDAGVLLGGDQTITLSYGEQEQQISILAGTGLIR